MKKIVTFTALGLILAASNANAAGFHLREQSAAALGNAFAGATAGAENISYAYFNVAGLTRHKGTQMNLGATYIAPEAKAKNVKDYTGQPDDNVDNIVHAAVAPNMSFSHQLNDEVTLGLGINVPFGMVTKYDRDWAGSDHGVTSKVTAVTTTPMVAWKATDKLSLGAGLPVQYFKAKLSNSALAMVDAEGTYTKVEGDTVDVGYQLGAMYEFDENTRVGINYRSEINHKLKGDIEGPRLPSSSGLLPDFLNQDINARIDTPAMLSIGAFHKLNDKWELMAEYQRVYWNSFDSISIYGDTMPKPGSDRISYTPEEWEDANFYALGASYNVNDQWKLRFGVAYDDAAVRVDYRTPRIPDSRRIWYSAGVGYKYSENLSFDMAYTFIKAKDARVDIATDAANMKAGVTADYKNQVHILGLSMNYKF